MIERKGIFSGSIRIVAKDGDALELVLDGAICELGMGEALGFAAAGWLASTPQEQRAELFQRMLAGFVAHACSSPGRATGGTVETFDIGPRVSEGKPS